MTLIVVDRFSVSTDVWARISESNGTIRNSDGFRKIFKAKIKNDTEASHLTPLNCIAFTGDAVSFYEWMVDITTNEPVLSLKHLIETANRIGGEFRIIIPAEEGAIQINNSNGIVAVVDYRFTEKDNIFVFGGVHPVPNHGMNASWFEPFLQAHAAGKLQSTEVERFFYAEGEVKKDKVLVGEEAKKYMKKRRRPWGSISHMRKRNK